MKKLTILLVMFAAFGFTQMMAQNATVSRNGTNFNVNLTVADTVSATADVVKIIGVGGKVSVQLYSIQGTADSISGTPTQTFILAGSMDNSNYVDIDTVSWAGTSSDTTFYWTDISTGVAWPYMRVTGAESSTGKSQLTKLIGRFFDEVR